MEFLFECACGCADFLVITEKDYNAKVDAEGTLVCLPQTEHIKTIACAKCGKTYKVEDFKQLEY
jgi:hypothetical protein